MGYHIFNSMLKEELNRLLALEKKYIEFIGQCPKGSIAIKKRNNIAYAYLAYRDKDRVFFKYIGLSDSGKVNSLRQKLKKCREYIINLKSVRNDIRSIKRILALKSIAKT